MIGRFKYFSANIFASVVIKGRHNPLSKGMENK